MLPPLLTLPSQVKSKTVSHIFDDKENRTVFKAIITAIAISTLAGNATAKDQTEYEQLDHKIKTLEIQAYQGSMVNAAAFELLCRESHPAAFCTDMYKKAAQSAKERAHKYTKEIFSTSGNVTASSGNVTASAPSKVILTDKWKDISLWRRQLKINMTQDHVLSILGEPDKVNVIGGFQTTWYYGYPSGGNIDFNPEGIVNSWSEPSF